jgi:uncharacterized membrane protein
MAHEDLGSRAAIRGHPLHPLLVPFPIAFFVGALATDLVFWSSHDPFWARGSIWLIGAGLVMGALAAIAGLIDFASIRHARNRTGWTHVIGNVAAVVFSLISWLIRLRDPAAGVLPTGLVLSVVVVVILLVTGWLGGELVFRYKIGTNQSIGPLPREPSE